jgi:hypothetical protein
MNLSKYALSRLALSPRKQQFLAIDDHFRRATDTLLNLFERDQQILVARIWNMTNVLLRPETIVERRIENAIELLCVEGIHLAGWRRLRVTPEVFHQIWETSIPKLTALGAQAMMAALETTDSLLLVLEDPSPPSNNLPLSVRISARKGSANPHERQSGTLRHALGGVQAPLLSYLHAPDDPGEVIREWGIYFSGELKESMEEILHGAADSSAKLTAVIDRLYTDTPHLNIQVNKAGTNSKIEKSLSRCAAESAMRSDAVSMFKKPDPQSWRDIELYN